MAQSCNAAWGESKENVCAVRSSAPSSPRNRHKTPLDAAQAARHTAGMIYKILRSEEWAALQANGETPGAPIDVADGYVHFSTADQVRETAAKHFADAEGLKLLAFDDANMTGDLRWEPSRGGALFPHLYGPLRLTDMIWVKDLPMVDGTHAFPDDLA